MMTRTDFSVQSSRRTILAATTALFLSAMLFGTSLWPAESAIHQIIEWGGIALMAVAILGRTWCSLYIGGKKSKRLIEVGPYSVSRNPLYVLSIIGAFGAGAQFASLTTGLIVGFTAYAVFRMLVLREESFLASEFGARYIDYLRRVPRFMPKLALWRDLEQIRIVPHRVAMTFVDGLAFLAAVPVSRLLEYWHKTGVLPVLFVLP